MEILFYLAVALFITYIMTTIIYFKKVPKSISDTYYQWKKEGYSYLFTTVMWSLTFLVLPYWVTIAPNALKFIPFLSISGLGFVGGACAFKETLTQETHYVSAGVWAFFALLYFALTNNWEAIVIGAGIGAVGWLLNKAKNLTFWSEIAVVIAMMLGLFMTIKL